MLFFAEVANNTNQRVSEEAIAGVPWVIVQGFFSGQTTEVMAHKSV